MPNLDAAKKAFRHSQRRRALNERWRRSYKATVKAVRDALRQGDVQAAVAAFPAAERALDRTARHNVLHPKTAARQKSRLQAAIKKMSA